MTALLVIYAAGFGLVLRGALRCPMGTPRAIAVAAIWPAAAVSLIAERVR